MDTEPEKLVGNVLGDGEARQSSEQSRVLSIKVSRSLYQFIDASTDAYKHIIPSSGLET